MMHHCVAIAIVVQNSNHNSMNVQKSIESTAHELVVAVHVAIESAIVIAIVTMLEAMTTPHCYCYWPASLAVVN